MLENSKIPRSRQKSVLEDLKELLQEYIEEKRIKSITYAISLKLLELLGPPTEFAELAEEDSPPEIKAFELKPSKVVERKSIPLEIKDIIKGTTPIPPLMDSKDPSLSTKEAQQLEEEEAQVAPSVAWQKHILFLGLLLPFCYGIIMNGLFFCIFSR